MPTTEQIFPSNAGFDRTAEKTSGLLEPKPGKVLYPNVATYAGKIVNRELQPGERVFRIFGPEGTSYGTKVGPSNPAGNRLGSPSFWGLNDVPSSAELWRQGSAVLDEWNRNGFIVIGTVLGGHSLPACTGLIAEQAGTEIGSQYLRGESKQAMLDLPVKVAEELNQRGARMVKAGGSEVLVEGGVRWEMRATGWDDVNGVYGYLNMPGPGTVQTARLGARTLAQKREE